MGNVRFKAVFGRPHSQTFWVEGFEYKKLVGEEVQKEDLAFLLERTDLLMLYRDTKGHLLSVALAAPFWKTFHCPASLTTSSIPAPPTSLKRTLYALSEHAMAENVIKPDVRLTIVQLILIAAQTTVEDYSERRKAIAKLMSSRTKVPKFVGRLGIKFMVPGIVLSCQMASID